MNTFCEITNINYQNLVVTQTLLYFSQDLFIRNLRTSAKKVFTNVRAHGSGLAHWTLKRLANSFLHLQFRAQSRHSINICWNIHHRTKSIWPRKSAVKQHRQCPRVPRETWRAGNGFWDSGSGCTVCTQCHRTVHLHTVKTANSMLYIFNDNNNCKKEQVKGKGEAALGEGCEVTSCCLTLIHLPTQKRKLTGVFSQIWGWKKKIRLCRGSLPPPEFSHRRIQHLTRVPGLNECGFMSPYFLWFYF